LFFEAEGGEEHLQSKRRAEEKRRNRYRYNLVYWLGIDGRRRDDINQSRRLERRKEIKIVEATTKQEVQGQGLGLGQGRTGGRVCRV
jgi:hypothetical protein